MSASQEAEQPQGVLPVTEPPAPPPYEPDVSLITELEKGLTPNSADIEQR